MTSIERLSGEITLGTKVRLLSGAVVEIIEIVEDDNDNDGYVGVVDHAETEFSKRYAIDWNDIQSIVD